MLGAGLGLVALGVSGVMGATAGVASATPYIIAGIACTALVRSLGIWSFLRHVNHQLEARRVCLLSLKRGEVPEAHPMQHLNIPRPFAFHCFTVGTLFALCATPWTATKMALPCILMGQNIFVSWAMERAQRQQQRLQSGTQN